MHPFRYAVETDDGAQEKRSRRFPVTLWLVSVIVSAPPYRVTRRIFPSQPVFFGAKPRAYARAAMVGATHHRSQGVAVLVIEMHHQRIVIELTLENSTQQFAIRHNCCFYLDADSTEVRSDLLQHGAGWGLAGFCPGPALTAVVIGVEPVVMLLLAMVVGMFIADQLFAPKKSKH